MLEGEALKAAARQLVAELQTKIDGRQDGVATFSDHVLIAFIRHLEALDQGHPWEESAAQSDIDGPALVRLRALLERRAQGRFVDYRARTEPAAAGIHGDSDIGYFDMVMSQGTVDCVQWKGMPIFKTVYDFSLYPMMLWAVRPQTIIELGSGTGASALWLADMTTVFGISCHVYSVDLKKPAATHERVTFLQGDCEAIEAVFDDRFLTGAAHPWMLIEDAHANVRGVLEHFHPYVRRGDYVVIEDSAEKQHEIRHFLSRVPGRYKVDSYYTDFFGRNATCAQDSILVRTDD